MEKEWGGWLRAQPRRVVGKSKWLREDGDDGWSERYGSGSSNQVFADSQVHGLRKAGIQGRNNRDGVTENANLKEMNISKVDNVHKAGDISNEIIMGGPSGDEMDGLDLEERKRKRFGPIFTDNMEVGNNVSNGSVLSTADCTESSKIRLATLAKQASRPL